MATPWRSEMCKTASKKFVNQGLPDNLQLLVHRTGQTIHIRPQGGVSDVHPVQLFHGLLAHRLVRHQLNRQGLTLRAVTGQASQVVLQQVGGRLMTVGLEAKNPQAAALQQRPELLVPRKTHQSLRQRTEQGQVRARITPKSPLIELRDLVQKLGPAVGMDCFHFSRSVAPIILAT